MTTSMMRFRRAGLGLIVAAFSIGMVATSTSGTVLSGAHGVSHTVSANHVWGN